jgi:chromosome partitioning protein
MLISPTKDNLNKIVILNPKGGCGKSTLATNLAVCYAKRGPAPAIMDFDPQGSTMAWLERRPVGLPTIHGIAANVIIDSPAGLNHDDLREITRDATTILVPVMPSSMDIHAASRCVADLLLVARVDRNERKLAVVANRTRRNTKSFGKLMRFLDSLGIPIIAVLRDSQNFVHAAEQGIGLHEMQPSRVGPDLQQLDRIASWLDGWAERRKASINVTSIRRQAFSKVSFLRKPQAESS